MKLTGSIRVQLTVSNFEASAAFYDALMEFLEANVVLSESGLKYWVSGRIALVIARGDDAPSSERTVPLRPGLHHISLRVRARRDVDRAHALVQKLGATVIHPPGTWPWGSGYYSFEFEDLEGIRLEISHARGKGYLDETMTVPIPRPANA